MGGAAVVALSAADRAGGAIARPAEGVVEGVVDALRPEVAPRRSWAGELPATGEIIAEDDVRFLLVHHTASRNDYLQDEVAEEIRDFYGFHTGPQKGWPDVAYNFFVDRFGGIWEARSGSIDGPVRGDATGGSQGFALLCSLIGDHSRVEVSPEALDSLTRLLAWLAERYGIDTAPGATVDFVSRGSNRWPAGAEVTANTISGHRDMSQTSCPGDFAYGLLAETIPTRVSAVRSSAAEAATPATSGPTTSSAPATTAGVTIVTVSTAPQQSTDDEQAPAPTGDEQALAPTGDDTPGLTAVFVGAAATVAAVIAAGAVRFRRRIER